MRGNLACVALVLGLAACNETSVSLGPDTTDTRTIDAQLRSLLGQWGAVPIGAVPQQDAAAVSLGRMLVFDPILSGNKDIACATCHHPSAHFADDLSLAIGTGGSGLGATRQLGAGREFVPRSAPTLINQGLGHYQLFWDGRLSGFGGGVGGGGQAFFTLAPDTALPGVATIVAAQAMLPVLNRREMRGMPGDTDRFGQPNELAGYADSDRNGAWSALMARLMAIPEYRAMFAAAFPERAAGQHGITHLGTAIAAFTIAALTKTESPFDRYLNRDDAALTLDEKRGALLFFGPRARCSSCHSGALLGGQQIANVGVPQIGPGVGASAPLDLGRGAILNNEFYEFAFRVPPLRNVELTAPYFHDGAYPTLEAVVQHYNNVRVSLETYSAEQVAPALRTMVHNDATTVQRVLGRIDFRLQAPLGLDDDERRQIVAFLTALTDPAARDLGALRPATVPSGLPVP
jgi:cytochrome c peroxidase